MGAADGVSGADRLDNDIKLIYAAATNCLINQHANTNRTAGMLQDEKKVEFLVVQDNFLTPTGKFADIVLPACTQFETWGLEDGWKFNNEILLMPQLVEPPGETKSDYRICVELAQRLGLEDEYTQGRDERAWVDWMIEHIRQTRYPHIPTLDEFEASNVGYYGLPVEEPVVAFADFRRDPEAYPLDTPSGRIEVFSSQLHDLNRPLDIPAVPKYIQEWESPFGEEAGRYPLQAIGHHTMQRVHSTHDNVDWLEEAFPQRIFINPLDAATRNIHDGDWVKVFNDRGTIALPCRITVGIMPGVVDIPQGAWWTPDENGIDWRGSVNVLTSERWTPFAFGNTQQTIMVQVEAIDVGDMPAQIRYCLQNEYPAAEIVKTKISPDSKEGQLFFYFDSSACTGCKSCQEACKDRSGLPVGMLWRRVYEISGGDWQQCGPAWQHDVVSYHLSIACNHCENPVCMDVCPADAIQKRPDGIVWIDEECCIGCQNCSEACPYGAMQFDERSQQMTKCDFCASEIDAGKAPACVVACPMWALDYGERAELEAKYHIRLNEQTTVYPLPAYGRTRPALLMRNHKDAERAEGKVLTVTNREEVE